MEEVTTQSLGEENNSQGTGITIKSNYAEIEERVMAIKALAEKYVKSPKGYFTVQKRADGCAYKSPKGLMVISSIEKKDNDLWLHVSYSYPNKTPTHADTCKVRKDFIGEDIYCYAIFPPEDKYVNIHPHCLHLWACITNDQ